MKLTADQAREVAAKRADDICTDLDHVIPTDEARVKAYEYLRDELEDALENLRIEEGGGG